MSEDSINVTVAVRLSLLEDKVDRLLAVQAEADARQRVMEAQVAKMSVMVGFVSAGISAAIAGTVAMFRQR
jgi:hypothetical protein